MCPAIARRRNLGGLLAVRRPARRVKPLMRGSAPSPLKKRAKHGNVHAGGPACLSGENLERRSRLAQLVEDSQGPGKNLAGGVTVDGDERLDSGAQGGVQAVRNTSMARQRSGPSRNSWRTSRSMSGAGFFAGTMSPAPITSNQEAPPGRFASSSAVTFAGVVVVAIASLSPFSPRLAEKALHPWAQRYSALFEADIVAGLGRVQVRHELRKVAGTGKCGMATVYVMQDALFSARDGKELAIEPNCPIPIEASLGERAIEGDPVPVPLGVRQGSVHIEDQRFQLLHYAPPTPFPPAGGLHTHRNRRFPAGAQ